MDDSKDSWIRPLSLYMTTCHAGQIL